MLYRPQTPDEYPDFSLPADFNSASPSVTIPKKVRWWREVLQLVAIGVIIYILVNVSTARASILGPSMRPNFETGQVVIINRLAYVVGVPERGDVVVVENPADRCKPINAERPLIPVPFFSNQNATSDCDDLFKRVIGLPGETVEAISGKIYIDGAPIDEPYIKSIPSYDGKWVLNDHQYFVLGDNRPSSYDSHNFGPVDRAMLYGKAWIRYWPLNEIEVIPHPDYK